LFIFIFSFQPKQTGNNKVLDLCFFYRSFKKNNQWTVIIYSIIYMDVKGVTPCVEIQILAFFRLTLNLKIGTALNDTLSLIKSPLTGNFHVLDPLGSH